APVPVLGAPVRGATDLTPADVTVSSAGYPDVPAVRNPNRAAVLGAPVGATTIPANTVETAVRQAGATNRPPGDPVNDLLTRRSGYTSSSSPPPARDPLADPVRPTSGRSSEKWGEKLEGWLGNRTDWFR